MRGQAEGLKGRGATGWRLWGLRRERERSNWLTECVKPLACGAAYSSCLPSMAIRKHHTGCM